MPRPSKGPHLWLRRQKGRQPVYIIKDNGNQSSTGCGPNDREGAEKALQEYIAAKYQPSTRETELGRINCADVINVYLTEHAPTTRSLEWIIHTATPVIEFWGTQTLADIRGQTCRQYVAWRTGQGVSDQTARHDLKTFRAAINYYHREYGPLNAVPAITMPRKGPAKARWLTRPEAASLVLSAYRSPFEHVLRTILIGLYQGNRPQTTFRLRWIPSTDAGWFDLDRRVMYRRGEGESDNRKRRPPVPISDRLYPHLLRWRARDMAAGMSHVIHWQGQPIQKLRRSWPLIREAAGVEGVTPHTLRHTCVTWLLQSGVPIWEVAGFVGMSEQMIEQVYGHHCPDHLSNAARSRHRNVTKTS